MKLRIANLFFALLFLYAAIVQYNDPDLLRWMAIYGAACLVSALYALRPTPRWPSGAVASAAAIWALILLPQVLRAGDYTGTEIERETGGLLIVALWMGFLWTRRRAAS